WHHATSAFIYILSLHDALPISRHPQAHRYLSARAVLHLSADNNATGMARFIHFAEPRTPAGAGRITRAVLRPALAVHSRNLMASSAMQRTPAAPTQALQAPHPALQCPAALHHPAIQLQA